jgi:hypothetical protein
VNDVSVEIVEALVMELVIDINNHVYFVCNSIKDNFSTKINPIIILSLNPGLPVFEVDTKDIKSESQMTKMDYDLFQTILKTYTLREFSLIRKSNVRYVFKNKS